MMNSRISLTCFMYYLTVRIASMLTLGGHVLVRNRERLRMRFMFQQKEATQIVISIHLTIETKVTCEVGE